MLRRMSNSSDGRVRSSLSGAILPGCASLVVPLLAMTALELPASAIDRIAAPMLGRAGNGASLFRPPAATTASGSSYGTHDMLRAFDRRGVLDAVSAGTLAAPPASSVAAARASESSRAIDARGGGDGGGVSSWIEDWSDAPMDPSDDDAPGDNGDPGRGSAGEGTGTSGVPGADGSGEDDDGDSSGTATGDEGADEDGNGGDTGTSGVPGADGSGEDDDGDSSGTATGDEGADEDGNDPEVPAPPSGSSPADPPA